jgi:hypothetical protein
VLSDDRIPFGGDLIQRFIPTDPFKLFAAFGAGSFERVEQTVRVIVALLVVFKFEAQAAACHRVIGVAGHGNQPVVLHCKNHAAGVWAIVRAAAVEGFYVIGRCVHGTFPRSVVF